MSTWMQEAVGIDPWPGTKLWRFGLRGSVAWTIEVAEDGTVQAHDEGAPGGCNPCEYRRGDYVLDLDHADTLAAFDRRLALRLGAPEDAVREGVVFFHDGGAWICAAGGYMGETRAGHNVARLRWYHDAGRLDEAADHLCARVRAWKSVP